MTEQELRDAKTKGEHARRLLEDEVLNEAIDHMQAQYAEAWLSSDPTEAEYRERLYMAGQLAGDFKRVLGQILSDGAIADDHLKKLQKRHTTDNL